MKKSHYLAAAAAITMLGAGALGIGTTLAAPGTATPSNSPLERGRTGHAAALVTAIATKFNLNPSEVQAVVEAQHQQMKADHAQKMADRLAQAVRDGKLTQAQADAMIAKQKDHPFPPRGFRGKMMGHGPLKHMEPSEDAD